MLDILDEWPKLAPVIALLKAFGVDLTRHSGDIRLLLMHEFGLSPAGWRWLLKFGMPAESVQPVDEESGGGYVAHLANVMAAMPVQASMDRQFVNHVAETYYSDGCGVDLVYKRWLLTGAWRHLRAMPLAEDREFFLLGEFIALVRWALEVDWVADANQRRAGWPAFQRAWRKATRYGLGPFMRWPVPFEQVQEFGLFAVAISNTEELWDEAGAMGHCISDYADACAAGTFLACSVLDEGGQHIATFSFEREAPGQEWRFHCCKGCFNADVEDERVDSLWWLALQVANQ